MAAFDKRYQVFTSSTYFDLQEERHAVIMALLQLSAIPAGMELFPAANENAWSLIRGVIDDCDYYLLVIGGRYGSIEPVEDIGYTEKEYDYAVSQEKPVMAFLHGNPDAIPVGKAERSEDAQKKLSAFRQKVERSKHVKYWTGPEDLAGKVALSFSQFTKSYPAVGWMRADQQASPEVLAEMNELRKALASTQQALNTASTSPPIGTEKLAQGQQAFRASLHYSLSHNHPEWEFSEKLSGSIWVEPSWDGIFSALGPLMLHESVESALKVQLDGWTGRKYWRNVKQSALGAIKSAPAEANKIKLYDYKASVSSEDFHTVIVQFIGLGLIIESDRHRGTAYNEPHWMLTPYGRTRLIQLRAVQSDSGSGASESPDS